VPFLISHDSSNEIRRTLSVAKPGYVAEEYAVEGHVNIFKWSSVLAVVAITASSLPIPIVIIALRAKALSIIHKNASEMSEKTMRMHHTLTEVLSLQAVLPVFFVCGVIDLLTCQFNIVTCSPIQEHLMMQAGSFIPLIAPAITLYYVQPYRRLITQSI
ncbi:hypothetical protein PMAYCL1PPCAC_16397, partial [Pristionchus mayeri]